MMTVDEAIEFRAECTRIRRDLENKDIHPELQMTIFQVEIELQEIIYAL